MIGGEEEATSATREGHKIVVTWMALESHGLGPKRGHRAHRRMCGEFQNVWETSSLFPWT